MNPKPDRNAAPDFPHRCSRSEKHEILMKRTSLSIVVGAALCLATISAAMAQTADNSVLYTPNVDLTTLTQNSFAGTVGGIFLTSYSYYPELNYLGYADPTGAP